MPEAKDGRTKSKVDTIKQLEQARNRDNQRRLRERRKEYTLELESRIRALEREGIHATEVVQKAARIVVEENRLLRQLLTSQGMPASTINEYVRNASASEAVKTPTSSSNSWSPISPPNGVARSGNETQTSQRSKSEHLSPTQPLGVDYHETEEPNIPPLDSGINAGLGNIPQPLTAPLQGCCANDDEAIVQTPSNHGPNSCTSSAKTRRSGIDEMDCEEAARIITSLRGGGNPEDVWTELGCSAANRISVKNAVVFSLAE